MIWSAYMGLPLSLEGAGAVLKLDSQKMKEGKDLIRYFCVPCKETKVNGGRTRNLPQHAPDKWILFMSYNKRDVEVEMAIQERLKKYPVPEPTVKFPPRERSGPVHISTLLDPVLEICSHPDRNRLLAEFFNR